MATLEPELLASGRPATQRPLPCLRLVDSRRARETALNHDNYHGTMPFMETLERIRSSPGPKNEESAKFQVIAPILHALGWDTSDGEQVTFEHSVGGKKGGRVDIALRQGGRVLALIEAKAPHSDLNIHVEQVLRYAFHEGVDICALTTGEEWWLYLPREGGEPQKRRFSILDLKEDSIELLAEDFDRFLGQANLASGQSHKQALRVLKANLEADRLKTEMPKIWSRMLKDPDNELVDLISRRVYDKLSVRPSHEQVVAVLIDEPVPIVALPTSEQSGRQVGSGGTYKQLPSSSANKPTMVVLWGSQHSVESYADVLRTVAEELYRRHSGEFDRLLELKGRIHPYVARNPQALLNPKRIYEVASAGYFIDMNLNAANVLRRAERFLECFGYPRTELQVLFD